MIDYKEFARQRRIDVLNMTHKAASSHIGSNFSSIDICAVLYNVADLSKDIILVKPWNIANVYACLVAKGLLPKEAVTEYGTGKWTTITEPIPDTPIIFGTGAMGYNLPAAVGFALAKKVKKEEGTVYCLISDGECQIGSTWESVKLAAQFKLDNLVVIVDKNGLQAMGETKDILEAEFPKDLRWIRCETDGHNYEDIEAYLKGNNETTLIDGTIKRGPMVIIADTIKGKGVSFMENNNLWHYSHVNKETYDKALVELNV